MTTLEQKISMPAPLVSLGIPTYNRSKLLAKAIDSALNQDYKNIEIIISDNASHDGTEALCRQYALKHSNIKYTRSPENLGPLFNFKQVLKLSSGQFFMWLADDDYIDSNYISECLRLLQDHDDVMIAGGIAEFLSGDIVTGVGKRFNIISESPLLRIITYIWGVSDNSIFYGVYRKQIANPDALIKCLAADWFYVAGILVHGKTMTSDRTVIHRTLGGASSSYESMIRTAQLHPVNAWFPGTMIGLTAVKEVLFNNANYKSLSVLHKMILSFVLFGLFVLVTGLYGMLHRLRFRIATAILGMENYNKIKRKYHSFIRF